MSSPAGLPVGVVHFNASGVPEVEPLARLDRLEIVRLFDYGLRGLLPPESGMTKPPGGAPIAAPVGPPPTAALPRGSTHPISPPLRRPKCRCRASRGAVHDRAAARHPASPQPVAPPRHDRAPRAARPAPPP